MQYSISQGVWAVCLPFCEGISWLRAWNTPRLAACITERLPRVELSEVLMEVDTWTHFSQHFVHRIDTMLVRWFPQRAAVGYSRWTDRSLHLCFKTVRATFAAHGSSVMRPLT